MVGPSAWLALVHTCRKGSCTARPSIHTFQRSITLGSFMGFMLRGIMRLMMEPSSALKSHKRAVAGQCPIRSAQAGSYGRPTDTVVRTQHEPHLRSLPRMPRKFSSYISRKSSPRSALGCA